MHDLPGKANIVTYSRAGIIPTNTINIESHILSLSQ